MPTYNAGKYLEKSIASILTIKSLTFEIIVADGGSTDNTLNILSRNNIKVIKNTKKIAEYGKYLAYKEAKSKYIVFIDADNVISSPDWLEKILRPLKENDDDILGVESNYFIASNFSSLNAYLALLVIVDPLARLLSSKPTIIQRNGYLIKNFKQYSSPISGANGFVWRKSVLDDFLKEHPTNTLEESTILNNLTSQGDVNIANVPDAGIYHYYCENVKDYMKKRRKIAHKFLDRQKHKTTWVDTRATVLKILTTLYLATVIGPSIEAVYNIVRTRRMEWFWHPFICWLTVTMYGFYFIKDKLINE